ncbi:hypothetical protein HDU67_006525 [Dinochytrium kinnereticum]|nr:hypothetical protein HDU67_006525 [Dinochytrium kinnereticum]
MVPLDDDPLPSTMCVDTARDVKALRQSAGDVTSSIQKLCRDHSTLKVSMNPILEHRSFRFLPDSTVKNLTSINPKELARTLRSVTRLHLDFTNQLNRADTCFQNYAKDRQPLNAHPNNYEDLDKTAEIAAGFRCLRANVQTAFEAVQTALWGQRRLFKLVDSVLVAMEGVERSNFETTRAEIAVNALKACFQEFTMEIKCLLGPVKVCLGWMGEVQDKISRGLKMVIEETNRLKKEKNQAVEKVSNQIELAVPNRIERDDVNASESSSAAQVVTDQTKVTKVIPAPVLSKEVSPQLFQRISLPDFSEASPMVAPAAEGTEGRVTHIFSPQQKSDREVSSSDTEDIAQILVEKTDVLAKGSDLKVKHNEAQSTTFKKLKPSALRRLQRRAEERASRSQSEAIVLAEVESAISTLAIHNGNVAEARFLEGLNPTNKALESDSSQMEIKRIAEVESYAALLPVVANRSQSEAIVLAEVEYAVSTLAVYSGNAAEARFLEALNPTNKALESDSSQIEAIRIAEVESYAALLAVQSGNIAEAAFYELEAAKSQRCGWGGKLLSGCIDLVNGVVKACLSVVSSCMSFIRGIFF